MLVLTRKIGETITIDDNIVIQIVKVRGGQVRVGIEAPSDVKILRGNAIKEHPLKKTPELVDKPANFIKTL